ncbi:MAG TPA: DUF177 domain-containing protein [Syntrophomonadaceae bacterium]|nr:DUF177 domain-containing protein [Syntrophomonadaceae bacterium]
MIINSEDLKIRPHTKRKFSLQEDYSDTFLEGVGGSFKEPVQVAITIENDGQMLTGKGFVRTVINLVCSRCLKDIEYQVNAPLNVIIKGTAGAAEGPSKEAEPYLLEINYNGDVDLNSGVEEAILFNLPLIPLCSDNCLGLCSGCGADLNTQKCRCEQPDIDPRWQKLKELK